MSEMSGMLVVEAHAEVEHAPLERKVAMILFGLCRGMRDGTIHQEVGDAQLDEWMRDLADALQRAGAP